MTRDFAHTTEKFFIDYWTIWHIGAGIGLLGGTFLLACGAFLTVFQYFYNEDPHGSWLFAIVLPLWIFGAHCFDKVEELEKAQRKISAENIL